MYGRKFYIWRSYIQEYCWHCALCERQADMKISPLYIKALHWLPVNYRIDFKITLLTYKALHDLALWHTGNILQIYHPRRTLKSAGSNLLLISRVRVTMFGRRSFHYGAPTLWNQLPGKLKLQHSISTFIAILKNNFFGIASS